MMMKWRMGAFVVLLILAIGSPASAQAPWPRPGKPSTPPPGNPPAYPRAELDRDQDTGADPETARNIAVLGTLIPVGAGAVTWMVQGDPSITSWVLIYFGSVEGPALGYRYAGLQRAAAEGEALRGGLSLCALLLTIDRKTDEDRDAVLGVGSALITGLAIYDCSRLPERIHRRFGARMDLHPALVAGRVVPAVTVKF